MNTRLIFRTIGRELQATLHGYALFFVAYLSRLIPSPFSWRRLAAWPFWVLPIFIVVAHGFLPPWLKVAASVFLMVWVFFMVREFKARLTKTKVGKRAGVRGAVLAVFVPFFLVGFTCLTWGLNDIWTPGYEKDGHKFQYDPSKPDTPEPYPSFHIQNVPMVNKGSWEDVPVEGLAFWCYTIRTVIGFQPAPVLEVIGVGYPLNPNDPSGRRVVARLSPERVIFDVLEAIIVVVTSLLFLGILGDIALAVQRKIQTGSVDLDLTEDHAVRFLTAIRSLNTLLEVDDVVKAFKQARGVLDHGITDLVRRLRDEDPQIRATAALVLGRLGEPRVTDELQVLLEDPAMRVRAAALTALGVLAPVKAGDHVFAILSQGDPALARTAIAVAGQMLDRLEPDDDGADALREGLLDCLETEDAEIREAVARLLTAFDDEETARELLERYETKTVSDAWRVGALMALGFLQHADGVSVLLKAARDDDPGLREAAARGLTLLPDRLSTPAVHDALARLVKNAEEPEALRIAALRGMSLHGGASDIAWLITVLRDASAPFGVQVETARCLGRLAGTLRQGGEVLPEDLFAALTEKAAVTEDSVLRDEACLALAATGDTRAREVLENLLPDPEAAQALGNLGDAEAIPALIGACATTANLSCGAFARRAPLEALGHLGPAAIRPLKVLFHDRPDDRETTARSLGRIAGAHPDEGASAAKYLVEQFRPIDVANVLTLAPALALTRSPLAREALERVLKRNTSSKARTAAARALGALGDPDAVQSLMRMAKTGDADVRDAVFSALGQYDSGVLPAKVLSALTGHMKGLTSHATAFLRSASQMKSFMQRAASFPFVGGRGKDGDDDSATGTPRRPGAADPMDQLAEFE